MGEDREAVVELIARVCHEANRAYAQATGEPAEQVLGPWFDVNELTRESARIGVRLAIDGATPEQLHESWTAVKRAAGWTYGPVRDNAALVHPCLVPYEELPDAQQRKDHLFHAIVQALQ